MQTQLKTTTWFVNGEKPAYPGVYNVSCRKSGQTGVYFSYWDGEYFSDFSQNIDWAYMYGIALDRGKYTNEKGSWRGLAENPEVN